MQFELGVIACWLANVRIKLNPEYLSFLLTTCKVVIFEYSYLPKNWTKSQPKVDEKFIPLLVRRHLCLWFLPEFPVSESQNWHNITESNLAPRSLRGPFESYPILQDQTGWERGG